MKKILLLFGIILFPTLVFASGDITVSPTSLTIEEGKSATFTIKSVNTVGDVAISSSDNNIAKVNISEWETIIEEGETKEGAITVTAVSKGTAVITLTLDAATFDGEDLSGSVRKVNVTVVERGSNIPDDPEDPSDDPEDPSDDPEDLTIKYVITYDSNGGSSCSPKTKEVNFGSSVGTLCKPTRKGYTFNGWFTLSVGGKKITKDSMLNEDTTLYAQWVKKVSNPKTGITTPAILLLAIAAISVIGYFEVRKRNMNLE